MESKTNTKAAKGWNNKDLHNLLERVDRRISENRRIIEKILGEIDERETE
ncbi:MAG: hypothetical protein R6U96_10745 [Promethearchaeia archaeon]